MVNCKFIVDSASHAFSIVRASVFVCFCLCASLGGVIGQEVSLESVIGSSVDEDLTATSNNRSSTTPRDPLAYSNERVNVKVSVAGVAQANGVTGSWWGLSESFAPSANYKMDRAWGELWLKPGVNTDFILSDTVQLYTVYLTSDQAISDVTFLSRGIVASMQSKTATWEYGLAMASKHPYGMYLTVGSSTKSVRACSSR